MNSIPADYIYHHMGIPTEHPRPGEKYSAPFKMWVTDGNNEFRIQWHRYEAGCPLHPLIQTMPHVAFKVPNIEEIWSDSNKEGTVIFPAS